MVFIGLSLFPEKVIRLLISFHGNPLPEILYMRTSIVASLIVTLLISGCSNHHFISDRSYREKVEEQFNRQKELAKNRADTLFGIFKEDLSTEEKEALVFLYAYMPLSDLADYDGKFFLQNVRSSLAARDTFSWGRAVPEDLFRHFVLPIRVNNENLDSSRWIFFTELKDRIRKLPMKDAVLEVNHWCHEKVTYRGSDGRTSSPLASVRTAYGRCGEESTFTVAAMRAVGIPARQCYTPRWAHSDDNHAWVEVWVDGKWHFIGACEPDADLDLAWFTAPAKRAMLVNTNVFGDYRGPEDILLKDPRFTRINVLSNYAATKRIIARVVDTRHKPVDSAAVEFQLYNYAEFYTLHRAFTDNHGLASFQTGYGDLLIWASKGGWFGYRKVTIRDCDTATIELSMKPGQQPAVTFDLVPPPEMKTESKVTDSMRARNTRRLEFEDKVRGAYESTFIDSAKCLRLAGTLKMDADTLWGFLKRSRGNWRGIIDFITGTPENLRHLIFPLLNNISDKDLRDATPEVLADQVGHTPETFSGENGRDLFYSCVLSPRIDNEWLKPYKACFRDKFGQSFREKCIKTTDTLIAWIRTRIAIDSTANWGRAPLTPVGAFELRVADKHSRDILFAAICRSFGIPARLEPGTRLPQYYHDGSWHDVYFEKKKQESSLRGNLTLDNDPANEKKPEYYTHFTVEKYESGFYRSLDYETDPLVNQFPCTLSLAPGDYLLVTGNRIQGGTVLASLRFFTLEAGKTVSQTVTLRKDQLPSKDYGKITPALFKSLPREGMILLWVDPDKEPSKHLFADLRQRKKEFENWKGMLSMIFAKEDQMKSFTGKESTSLPANIHYTLQAGFPVKPADLERMTAGSKDLPVVIYATSDGNIRYLSTGYRIGLGDDLMNITRKK